jgi:hypothetical protein
MEYYMYEQGMGNEGREKGALLRTLEFIFKAIEANERI